MDYTVLQEKYRRLCQLVTDQRLREAFILLQELTEESHKGDLQSRLENHRETYRNILRYSFGEVEDPDRKKVFFRLLRHVIELADETFETIVESRRFLHYSLQKTDPETHIFFPPEEIPEFLQSLSLADPYWQSRDMDVDTRIDKGLLEQELAQKQEKVFYHYWLTDKFLDFEKEFAHKFLQNPEMPWWNQCMLVSSITLSLQRYFDESKFELLVDAYERKVNQVWQRALVGIIVTLYQYRDRLFLYPGIEKIITSLQQNPELGKHTESVLLQFIKARDTEKIAQKFRDEIFPEMARIQTRIYDKLDLNNLMQDPLAEDKNPDWEHVFHDAPGLVNKLEEFSMMQMEGSDVFLSTFAMLKQFDFFQNFPNWFLPFYKENPGVIEALRDEDESFDAAAFASGMEKSSVLCNSDKYSFCLNVKRMPSMQRKMMIEIFNMEIKAMEEISNDEELLHKPGFERVIIAQYIQDLYRFYKLYSMRQEFSDIFSTRMDFHNTDAFRWLISDDNIVRNIGEFLFEKNHYQEAIEVFSQFENSSENSELWQKIAYSYQQLGSFEKALEYYLRADLTDVRKVWNIKKIAYCYRKLNRHEKALEYYQEAARMEPENLQVQANLAHTYFDLKDFDNALKVYFKVEYLAPNNHKIQRPIAWCALMQGKLETAGKYFEKVLQIEGNQHDLLNLGHVDWCLGNKQKAIDWYLQSLRKSSYNFHWFADELQADSEILEKYNIDSVDIQLMQDYLKILSEQER